MPIIAERNRIKYPLTALKVRLAEAWQLCSSVHCDMVCAKRPSLVRRPYPLFAGYIFRLLTNLEDGGSTFLRNVGKLLPD
jgi:hypothetical protein